MKKYTKTIWLALVGMFAVGVHGLYISLFVALPSGVAYGMAGRMVSVYRRLEDPFGFWINVTGNLIIALGCIGCPIYYIFFRVSDE